MRISSILLGIFLLSLLFSCDIKKSDLEPEAAFVRVYESGNSEESYFPEDIVQLSDNRYLVLSSFKDSVDVKFPGVCLLALDADGQVLAREILPESLTNPVPGWMELNGEMHFICMDKTTLEAKLFGVELSGNSLSYSEVRNFELQMPLYARSNAEGFILLSYDYSRYCYINKFDRNLNDQWETRLATREDFGGVIYSHQQKLSDPVPFFIDEIKRTNGTTDYFVNCLENSSLALVFLNGASGTPYAGRVYSFQEGTGLSAALHLKGDTFALARYHSGSSYVFPKAMLNQEEVIMTRDFEDLLISQLKADARTDILRYELNNREFIVFASTTKSNQVMLLFYDAETGLQAYDHILGSGNPVDVVSLKAANDGGLIVLGKTFINGQYQRIILYKIDKQQLDID